MNKLKPFLCIMLLTSFASQEALANSLNQDDMAFAFGNNSAVFSYSDLGDIAPLSHQEMIETEGKVLQLIPWFYGLNPALVVATVQTGYAVARGLRIYTNYYYGSWVPPLARSMTQRIHETD